LCFELRENEIRILGSRDGYGPYHADILYWTSTGGYECTGTRIQFFEFEELTEAPDVGAIPVCVGVIVECLRYWGHATGGYIIWGT